MRLSAAEVADQEPATAEAREPAITEALVQEQDLIVAQIAEVAGQGDIAVIEPAEKSR